MSDLQQSQEIGEAMLYRRPSAWVRTGLDLAEKLFVVVLYGLFAVSLFGVIGSGGNWFNLVQLCAEGLASVFILLRKPATVVSYRPLDWVLSIAATTGALLARPGHLPSLGPPELAGALILAGLIGQIWGKLTLRLSFGVVPANRGLKVEGAYRLVRHPIYLGYFIGWAGFFLLNPTFWNLCVYSVCFLLQTLRIEAEERVLSLDPAYADYSSNVRFKLIPGLY